MTQFSRIHVVSTIKNIGLIPIFYNDDLSVAKNIVNACVEAGAPVIEFVARGKKALEVFKLLEQYCRQKSSNIVLGVGSILDVALCKNFIEMGADFVVAPAMDREVAILCNNLDIPYIPGCQTVTEIYQAHLMGVDICKLFPGDAAGGPEFVKAVKAPMPWVELIPTGGVEPTEDNLKRWFNAGVCAVGMGSKLITPADVRQKNFAIISHKIKDTLQMITHIRGMA